MSEELESLNPDPTDIHTLTEEDLDSVSGGDCTTFNGSCGNFSGNCGSFGSTPVIKKDDESAT